MVVVPRTLDLTNYANVEVPDVNDLNGLADFTVEVVFRSPEPGWYGGNRLLLERSALNKKQFGLRVHPASGGYQLSFQCSGDGVNMVPGYVPNGFLFGRQWHQILATKQGVDWRVHIDGQLRAWGSNFPAVLSSVTGVPLYIGAGAAQGSPSKAHFFRVSLWPGVAFQPEDVADLWQKCAGVPCDPNEYPIVPAHAWGGLPDFGLPTVRDLVGLADGIMTPDSLPSPLEPAPYRPEVYGPSQQIFNLQISNYAPEIWMLRRYSARPALLRLDARRLLGAYDSGLNHADDAGEVRLVRSDDNGETWPISQRPFPGEIATDYVHPETNTPNRSDKQPTLSRAFSGRILLAWGSVAKTTLPERQIWMMTSLDNGLSFSDARPVTGLQGTRFQMLGGRSWSRPDGAQLMPYYYSDIGRLTYTAGLAISWDEGETWAHYSDLVVPSPSEPKPEEPCILPLHDGRWLAHVREDDDAHAGAGARIIQVISEDGGATWSAPTTAFPGKGRPELVALRGILVCFTRDSSGYGIYRTSPDQGVSWGPAVPFQDPDHGEFQYCSAIPYSLDAIAVLDGQQAVFGNTAGPSQVMFRVLEPIA